jgi:hypothetical protein
MIAYKAKASSTNLNAAFLSKTQNSTTTGKIAVANTANATSSATGALTTTGGAGIAQDLYVGGQIYKNGVAITGDVSFANVGTTPSPKGATVAAQVITLQPADLLNPGLMTTGAQSIAGVKTFQDKAYFQGGIEVTGPSTIINATELQIKDAYITLNKGGTNTSAELAGVEIERVTGGNAGIQFDSTLTSKWKLGIVGALYEVIVAAGTQTIGGLKTFSSLLTTGDLLVGGKLLKGVQTNTQSGTSISLTNPTKPVVIVTNAGLVSIYDIGVPTGGSQTFVLVNKTGVTIKLLNGSNGDAGTIQGMDADLELTDGKTLQLVFDTSDSKWRIVGGTGSGGSNVTILGRTSLALNDQTKTINFLPALPSTSYNVKASFENLADADPIAMTFMVTAKTTNSFTVKFIAPTDSANYLFAWEITKV